MPLVFDHPLRAHRNLPLLTVQTEDDIPGARARVTAGFPRELREGESFLPGRHRIKEAARKRDVAVDLEDIIGSTLEVRECTAPEEDDGGLNRSTLDRHRFSGTEIHAAPRAADIVLRKNLRAPERLYEDVLCRPQSASSYRVRCQGETEEQEDAYDRYDDRHLEEGKPSTRPEVFSG